MSTYILWDIDGTLILGNSRAGALYLDSIEQVLHAHGLALVRGSQPSDQAGG